MIDREASLRALEELSRVPIEERAEGLERLLGELEAELEGEADQESAARY